MAITYPDYVVLRPVAAGRYFSSVTGEPLRVELEVWTEKSLVWNATGDVLEANLEAGKTLFSASAGEKAVAYLPVTDQPGWIDADTGALIDVSEPGSFTRKFRAKITVKTAAGKMVGKSRELGPFTVPEGNLSEIDLEKLLPVGTVDGDRISIPDTWTATVEAAAENVTIAVTAAQASAAAAGEAQEAASDALAAVGPVVGDVADLKALVTTGDLSPSALTTKFGVIPGRQIADAVALPSALYNPIEANAVAFSRSNNITLPDGSLVAVWWNAGRRPMIGRYAAGAWTTFDLSTITGNPLKAPLVDDGHNNLVVLRDSAGYLHVFGNMHDMGLRYVRSTAPDSITGWAAAGMVGVNEDAMTYFQAVTVPGYGALGFYRNGSSISGDLFLNRHDAATQTWSRVAQLLKGSGFTPAENGYIDQPMVDDDGRIGLFVVWRAGSSFLTTHDITYIQSRDGGTTWESIDGTPLTLPIRPPGTSGSGSAAPIAFPVAQNAGIGLINQAGAVFDEDGHPHTARWLYDTADKTVYRLRHYWHDGAAWQSEVVATTTGPNSSTGTIGISRPSLFKAGKRVFVIWRDTYQAPQLMNVTDITPGADRLPTFPLATMDLGGYEPNFDYDAMLAGTLNMLVTPTLRDPNQVAGGEEWFGQWGAILSVDLSQIEYLAQRPAPLALTPRTGAAQPVTTSSVARADGPAVPVAEPTRDVLVARLAGNPRAVTAAGVLALQQRAANRETGVDLAVLPVPAGGRAARALPWVATRPDIEDVAAGAVVLERHGAGAAGSLDATAVGLELAAVTVGGRALGYTGPRGGTLDKLGRLAAYWNISALALTNDASVANVPDTSGRGRPLAPHATAPTFKAAGINGAGAVRFASNAALKSAAFALGNEYAIVTVAAADATPTPKDEQAILAAFDSANATPRIHQLRYDMAAADGGAPPSISAISLTQLGNPNTITEPITSPATPRLIAVRRYWSTYRFIFELWINGELVEAHAPAPSGGNPGADGAAPWFMGGRFSGGALTEFLGGYVGDTVMFDQYLNNAEFRAAQARIARTYGIPLP